MWHGHFKRLAGRKISPLNFLFSTTQALLDIYHQTLLCGGKKSPSCINVKTAGIQAFWHRLVPCSGCFYFHGPADDRGERGRPVKTAMTRTIRRGYDFHSLAHHFQTVQQALQCRCSEQTFISSLPIWISFTSLSHTVNNAFVAAPSPSVKSNI